MKQLAIWLILFAASDAARANEPWSMVWVVRSTEWSVQRASGQLNRSGDTLRGQLSDGEGTAYSVLVKLKGKTATGTFEVIPGDAGKAMLTGTYTQSEGVGINTCWETISLSSSNEFVGLARSVPCEP